MPPPDSSHRDAARLKLDHNVVVEAGAGTGKTTLLTDRILFLLLGRGLPVGSVVALTFTEKAAGEIKLRLTERLLEIVGGRELPEVKAIFGVSPEKAAERARAALQDMDKAQVNTIHSFCSHILRLYPVEAGVDPGLRIDKGPVLDELFTTEWARFLDVELGEKAPRAQAWIEVLRHVELEDLAELVLALCKDDALELSAIGRPDPAAAGWLMEQSALLRGASEGHAKLPSNSKLPLALDSIHARLQSLSAAAASAVVLVPALDSVEPEVLATVGWSTKWPKEHEELYDKTAKLAKRASPASEAVVRAAWALVHPFIASFRETYARKGWISFQGLLRKARDLVRDNPEVRERLKAQYQALLIDEFQDTDPLQGELLLFLAESEGRSARNWRDIKLGPGRLFVVGDPKQSIYRFRGADIAAYQGFTRHVLANGKSIACDLTANFRSHCGVIDPVNGIFEKVMEYKPGCQPLYKSIQPQGKPEADAFKLLQISLPDTEDKKASAADTQRTEAAWAAKWIDDNCGPGKSWSYKDVALLFRASAALPHLVDALKSRGIPYAVEMEKYFYGAAEVRDFLNLLSALDDPGDRVAVAGLLRSPLVALEDSALMALAQSSGGLNYQRKPASAPARVSDFYAQLRGLRDMVGRVPLGQLVEKALIETSLLETAARAYHGQQTVANLVKFARMASDASDERGLTLKEFISRVALEMRDSAQEGESPLADDYLDAVRILTIHKSKGLEFPVVFLLNAAGKDGGESKKPQYLLDWSTGRVGLRVGKLWGATMAALYAQEEERQWEETLRLLYVALTRSKRRTFVLGSAKKEPSSLSEWLREAGVWPPGESVPAGEGVSSKGRGASPIKPVHPLPPQKELEAIWTERGLRKAQAEAKRWTTSATAQRELAGPPPALEEGELSPAVPDAALIGQACHAVLERWDFAGGSDLKRACAEACARLRMLRPLADWPSVERETAARLYSFLESDEGKALARLEIVGREVPFVYAEGGTVVRGSIDLLVRENGKLVVLDYKTGRARGHEAQGKVYKTAVEKALGEPCEFRVISLSAPVDA